MSDAPGALGWRAEAACSWAVALCVLASCASGGMSSADDPGEELVGDPTAVPSRVKLEASMVVACESRSQDARTMVLSDAGWLSLLGEGEPLKWCAEPGEALGLSLQQLVSGARLCLEEHPARQVAMRLSARPSLSQTGQGCGVVVETLSHQGRRWVRVAGSPVSEVVVEVYEVLGDGTSERRYVGTPELDNHCVRDDLIAEIGSEFETGVSEALRTEWMVLPEVVRAFVCSGR